MSKHGFDKPRRRLRGIKRLLKVLEAAANKAARLRNLEALLAIEVAIERVKQAFQWGGSS